MYLFVWIILKYLVFNIISLKGEKYLNYMMSNPWKLKIDSNYACEYFK